MTKRRVRDGLVGRGLRGLHGDPSIIEQVEGVELRAVEKTESREPLEQVRRDDAEC